MRILVATPFFYPLVGGTELGSQNLAVELNNRGISADVLTFNQPVRGEIGSDFYVENFSNYKVFRIPAYDIHKLTRFKFLKAFFNISFIPKINLSEIAKSYDIIHFQDDNDFTFPFFLKEVNKVKIMHLRSFVELTKVKYERNFILRYFAKKFIDFYFCNTDYTNSELRLVFPNVSSKRIYNGLNTEIFKPNSYKKMSNFILYVGRISRLHGLDILLNSIKELSMPINLVIAGRPHRYDNFYLRIRQLITEINKETPHKIFYLGKIDYDALIPLYQKCSFLVNPFWHKIPSFGNVNAEAQSCGLPVICSSKGGFPEIVKNNETGFLFNQLPELPDLITKLLTDDTLRLKMSSNARKHAVENFSFKSTIPQIIELYESLLRNDNNN